MKFQTADAHYLFSKCTWKYFALASLIHAIPGHTTSNYGITSEAGETDGEADFTRFVKPVYVLHIMQMVLLKHVPNWF